MKNLNIDNKLTLLILLWILDKITMLLMFFSLEVIVHENRISGKSVIRKQEKG